MGSVSNEQEGALPGFGEAFPVSGQVVLGELYWPIQVPMVPSHKDSSVTVDLKSEGQSSFTGDLFTALLIKLESCTNGACHDDEPSIRRGIFAEISDKIAERYLGGWGPPHVFVHRKPRSLIHKNLVRGRHQIVRWCGNGFPVHASQQWSRCPDVVCIGVRLALLRNLPTRNPLAMVLLVLAHSPFRVAAVPPSIQSQAALCQRRPPEPHLAHERCPFRVASGKYIGR